MSFTPGPWKNEGWEGLIVNAADGSTITAAPGGGKNAPLTEIRANARLIAQAPAMYAALREIFRDVDARGFPTTTDGKPTVTVAILSARLQAARAALDAVHAEPQRN